MGAISHESTGEGLGSPRGNLPPFPRPYDAGATDGDVGVQVTHGIENNPDTIIPAFPRRNRPAPPTQHPPPTVSAVAICEQGLAVLDGKD